MIMRTGTREDASATGVGCEMRAVSVLRAETSPSAPIPSLLRDIAPLTAPPRSRSQSGIIRRCGALLLVSDLRVQGGGSLPVGMGGAQVQVHLECTWGADAVKRLREFEYVGPSLSVVHLTPGAGVLTIVPPPPADCHLKSSGPHCAMQTLMPTDRRVQPAHSSLRARLTLTCVRAVSENSSGTTSFAREIRARYRRFRIFHVIPARQVGVASNAHKLGTSAEKPQGRTFLILPSTPVPSKSTPQSSSLLLRLPCAWTTRLRNHSLPFFYVLLAPSVSSPSTTLHTGSPASAPPSPCLRIRLLLRQRQPRRCRPPPLLPAARVGVVLPRKSTPRPVEYMRSSLSPALH
ncbi:hypothetical protein B0H16DRAFT_1724146 [Mycena metata]|uniref:Uncharacterized protein n=1 Tax=Mycena metata TaxID=1033252 RepID=A0AAD7IVL7_9AGAR|nr:hypothetical protein B0H16DRAFT_1724146 [Mycena metata]